MHPQVIVRKAREAQDWEVIRKICVLTGSDGNPIAHSREAFFGELWVGPYEKFVPAWSYLAESEGEIAGYLTGCPNTFKLNIKKAVLFQLPLAMQILFGGRFGKTPDVRRFLRQWIRLESTPEKSFSFKTKRLLKKSFPAHLHINLKPHFRGKGIGRDLIEAFATDLKASEISGIHLYCRSGPLFFYKGLGFQELEKIEIRPGVAIYALGLTIL